MARHLQKIVLLMREANFRLWWPCGHMAAWS